MFVQSGAIIYVSSSLRRFFICFLTTFKANIYRADDKPLYKRGNRTLIAICSMNIVLYALVWLFYRTLNKKRAAKWNAMTKEVFSVLLFKCTGVYYFSQDQDEYFKTTKDEGNARLDFRFAY